MTERLFLGGPANGRWINVAPDDPNAWRVPVIRPLAFEAVENLPSLFEDSVNIGTYRRRLFSSSSWRIPLTFYVADGWLSDGQIPIVSVLPGAVYGQTLEQCRFGCDHLWVRGSWPRPESQCCRCFVDQWPDQTAAITKWRGRRQRDEVQVQASVPTERAT